MKIHCEPNLSLGWLVGKFQPPQLAATFMVKGVYRLQPGKPASADDMKAQPMMGDVHFDDDEQKSLKYASDFAPKKPRADVLLVGSAHAPRGVAVPSLTARYRVGGLSKRIEVIGHRTKENRFLGKVSAPAPFVAMPIVYENAFGGPEDKKNPVGKGRHGDPANLESPKQPGAAASADPVGFGPLAATWSPRADRLGTYDKKWLKTRWPWLPEDFDWSHFNAAPRDQQLEGYLRGDEELEFENLHPQHAIYRSRLPGVRARCFLEDRLSSGELRFREAPLVLDTLWVDMDKEELVLLWRGHTDVRTLKLKEIEQVYAISEPLKSPAQKPEQYRAELERRFVERENAEAISAKAKAEAEHWAAFHKRFAEIDKEFAEGDKLMARMDAEATQGIAEHQARLRTAGIEPTRLEEPAAAPTLAQGIAELATTIAVLRHHSPDHAARLEQELVELKQTQKEIEQIDKEMAEASAPKWTRERVAEAAARRESLARQDLAELDLSELALAGIDFTEARLKNAKLGGANLAGARLTGADLSAADLTKADLTGANLDDANLRKAILDGAKLTRLSLAHATLAKLSLPGADFSASTGRGADFSGAFLAGARFTAAKLPQADFTGCNLEQANFISAELQAAQFGKVKAREIKMEGADISGLQAAGNSDFTRGNFKKCNAKRAIFEKATLNQSDFSKATLTGAQFSEASLREATFDRAVLGAADFADACLRRAVLTNANFIRSSFDRADLTEADLRGSNFYESGFWETITERAELRNANLKSTLLS